MQFVVNYEEGGESCILDSDKASEIVAVGDRRRAALALASAISIWNRSTNMVRAPASGASGGCLPAAMSMSPSYGVTLAMARNPEAVAAMKEAGWKSPATAIAGWNTKDFSEEEERKHIREADALAQRS